MKKSEVVLNFEEEKLDALAYFLGKENTTPQKELAQMLEELYQQHVPDATREYIESKSAPAAAARPRPKRPVKSARRNAENGDAMTTPETAQEGDVSDGQP